MSQPFRLDRGSRIDRSSPMRFTFDGRAFTGYAGDTLASALLANGVRIVARSFKYHRPRGLLAAGAEEPNGLVQLEAAGRSTPNVRATEVPLVNGLIARSQNAWPSAQFDVAGVLDRFHGFLPPGFYHKTFKWPSWSWYEPLVRRSAGLGQAPRVPDRDSYAHRNLHCEVLVIGAGPAGLAAAVSAVAAGADTVLVDDHDEVGGSLRWSGEQVGALRGEEWVRQVLQGLEKSGRCRVLSNTCIVVAGEGRGFIGVETPSRGGTRERLWKIRARSVVLATGAIERPLVFPDNDRPGIVLAGAAREYLGRFAVAPGRRAVVFVNDDSGYLTVPALKSAGMEVAAVVDVRPAAGAEAVALLGDAPYWPGHVVTRVSGRKAVRGVRIATHVDGRVTGRESDRIACDSVIVSGGWSPAVHLAAQAGAQLLYARALAAYVVGTPPEAWRIVGSAAGAARTDQCVAQGGDAGTAAAGDLGLLAAVATGPESRIAPAGVVEPASHWMVEFADRRRRRRQWIDLLYDVTVADLKVAASEGFDHPELIKRYTSAGMAPDQGKTGQMNTQGAVATITGRPLEELRPTTARPPLRPVTLGLMAGLQRGDLYRSFRLLPAHEAHVRCGARFDDYGGWQRPACYPLSGETVDQAIRREVTAARTTAAILDGSPLGKLEVVGREAATFLDRVFVNNILTLPVGRIRYVVMLNERGVVVDDGVVVRMDEHRYLVNSTSARAEATRRWLERLRQVEWPDLDVTLLPVTEQWATLAISGPQARRVVEALDLGIDLAPRSFPHMAFREGRLGVVTARVCRVSFTGEASFEVSVPASAAVALFEQVIRCPDELRVTPIGIESLATLRKEKGYLHVGTDTDGATTADDVGLRPLIERKPRDFVGRRSLDLPENRRAGRRCLVGLVGADATVALPAGAHLLAPGSSGPSTGTVTSSCISPTLGKSIAMALLASGRQRIGQTVTVWSEGRSLQATVTDLPFYDPAGERMNG